MCIYVHIYHSSTQLMNAARVDNARALLKKLEDWGRVDIDYFTLYPVSNYFDLLYDPEANGNHDSTGSYIIGDRILSECDIERKDEVLEALRRCSPSYLFEMTDLLHDHVSGVIYNYDLAKREYERVYGEDFSDEEFKKRYREEFEVEADVLHIYPILFVEEMKKFPLTFDRDYLRATIRRETDELITWLEDPEEEKGTGEFEHLKLTDEEVEMLLDAHFRILDGALKINDLVTPENLAGDVVERDVITMYWV
jgi:hypothetical protein